MNSKILEAFKDVFDLQKGEESAEAGPVNEKLLDVDGEAERDEDLDDDEEGGDDKDIKKAIRLHRLQEDYEKIAKYLEENPPREDLDILGKPGTAVAINLDALFKGFDDLLEKAGKKGMKWKQHKANQEKLDSLKKLSQEELDKRFSDLLRQEEKDHDNMIRENYKKKPIQAKDDSYEQHLADAKHRHDKLKADKKRLKTTLEAQARSIVKPMTFEEFGTNLHSTLQSNPDTKHLKVSDFTDNELKRLYGYSNKGFNKAVENEEVSKGYEKTFAVGIITNINGEILLLRRSWSAPWADYKWSLLGGTIEPGEEPVDALLREIKEEIQIDTTPDNCLLFLTVEEVEGDKKYLTYYYSIQSEEIQEENFILNYENDKYQYVSIWEDASLELIPNLDVVFDYLRNVNTPTEEVDSLSLKIEKGFTDLLDTNPFTDNLVKASMANRAGLRIKEITDKLGRKVKKWVRSGEDEKGSQKQGAKEEEGHDYHSIYKNEDKVKEHAKNSSVEDLQDFIKREGKNSKASKLIKVAKAELKSRGIKVEEEPEEKNPYGNKKEKTEGNSLNKKQNVESEADYEKRTGKKETKTDIKNPTSEDVKDHLDLITSSDNVNELKNHLTSVGKDKKLSDEEKQHVTSEIHKQIGKLVSEGGDKPEAKKEEGEGAKTESKQEATKSGTFTVHEKDFNANDYLKSSGIAMSEKDMTPEQKKDAKWQTDPDTGVKYDLNSGAGIQDLIQKSFEKQGEYKKMKKIQEDMNKTYDKIVTDPNFRFAFVGGAPGLGKTFGLKKLAKDENKKRAEERKENGTEEPRDIQIHIPSTLTKAGLMDMLYKKNGSENVIVVDDKDDIWQDPDIINILKTATNTNGADRVIQAGTKVSAGDKKEAEKIKKDLASEGIDIDNITPEQATPEVREKVGEYKKLLNLPIKFNGKIVVLSNQNMPTDPDDEDAPASLTKNAHHYAALKDRGSVDFYKLNNDQRKMLVTERVMNFVPGADIDDTTGQMSIPTISPELKVKTAMFLKNNFDKIKQEVGPRELYKVFSDLNSGIKQGKKPEQILENYFGVKKEIQKAMSNDIYQNLENLILGI